jgi:hypothetical protein
MAYPFNDVLATKADDATVKEEDKLVVPDVPSHLKHQ